MNEQLIKIGLESGMLNYVDNETPRHYFLSGHADEQDLAKFAELIVRECTNRLVDMDQQVKGQHNYYKHASIQVLLHFGIQL